MRRAPRVGTLHRLRQESALPITISAWVAAASMAGDTPDIHELRNMGGWFLAGEVVGSAAIGFLLPDLVLGDMPDDLTCADAWCRTEGFDEGVRDVLLAGNPRVVGQVSHVFTLGAVPAVGIAGVIVPNALAGHPGEGIKDAVVVLDAFLIATGPNSIAKVSARRQRPGFHHGVEAETEAAGHPDEEFVSFYSGDTTWAFALAASSTTLSALRGHRTAPWLGVTTGALALTGGLLRISGDMHWATDVAAGALVGTGVGVALPIALHGRRGGESLTVRPMGRSGVAISGRW